MKKEERDKITELAHESAKTAGKLYWESQFPTEREKILKLAKESATKAGTLYWEALNEEERNELIERQAEKMWCVYRKCAGGV